MLSKTRRTEIKKGAHKACTDPKMLYRIIDESLIAHVVATGKGTTKDNKSEGTVPIVIPVLAWRIEDQIYVHGANNSRLFRELREGGETSLTFTLFDGWVLARSAMHHSAHYRSAVVIGRFSQIVDRQEKSRVLTHFVEQIAPGRSDEVRPGSDRELDATMVLKMPLTEASVKIGDKGVNDDEGDMDRPVWAGIVPYRTVVGPLIADGNLLPGVGTPDYSGAYGERWCEQEKKKSYTT